MSRRMRQYPESLALTPRVSFMLSPPFRWPPALRRAEPNIQKHFEVAPFWHLFRSKSLPNFQKCVLQISTSILYQCWANFIEIYTHLGPQNQPKINKKSSAGQKTSKIEKPTKTTVFTMVFEGLGLKIPLKNPPHCLAVPGVSDQSALLTYPEGI